MQHNSSSPERREPLSGIVERVTFHNPENGFCVLRVKARGHRQLVTLLGHAASISAGELVEASGWWQNTVEHGLQFKSHLMRVAAPSSAEGIERYLGSGMIRGIGRELAKRLVKAFGDKVFDVIEQHPERLRTVDGIGPVRIGRILEGWAEQKAIRDIMVFLQSHRVGTSRAVRIYRTYGADSVPLISENPYRLARDIRGIGFKTADQIAESLGVEPQAMIRARAGLSYTLLEAVNAGHCGLPEDELLQKAETLLEIPSEKLSAALAEEIADSGLIADSITDPGGTRQLIFLTALWQAERTIAGILRNAASGPPPWGMLDAGAALDWVQQRLGLELATSQRQAVAQALHSRSLVITGGPGVGKTTLVRAILEILCAKSVETVLCAPTGRAAKRLAESTGLEAKTIHRLLKADPRAGGFRRNRDNPLECDLLVVDEMSMVDVPLMSSLLQALPAEAAMILVGDVDQLPSVGPGQVLRSMIDSEVLPVARLTEVFRQAAASRIVVNAHRLNQGLMPEIDAYGGAEPAQSESRSDFFFVPASDPEDAQRKVVEIVRRRIPRRFGFDSARDVQVLCPMNRGGLGARGLNVMLQEALNPPRPGQVSVERFGWTFRVRDKVMQTENDYDKEVFNGDLGVVEAIEPESQELIVSFDQRSVAYRFGELDQVALAYATTIHKSQGSEYPAVVIPITMQHYVMLQRNLIYTGVTRGRELVVLVGDKKALAMAVRGRPMANRYTKLTEWLQQGVTE